VKDPTTAVRAVGSPAGSKRSGATAAASTEDAGVTTAESHKITAEVDSDDESDDGRLPSSDIVAHRRQSAALATGRFMKKMKHVSLYHSSI
jgi:hypothetical protein